VMPKQPSSPAARLVKPGLGDLAADPKLKIMKPTALGYWKNVW
jgi:hypothetical protein